MRSIGPFGKNVTTVDCKLFTMPLKKPQPIKNSNGLYIYFSRVIIYARPVEEMIWANVKFNLWF